MKWFIQHKKPKRNSVNILLSFITFNVKNLKEKNKSKEIKIKEGLSDRGLT